MNPQELIPPYWHIEVNSLEDIAFFGTATVQEMIKRWERQYTDFYYESSIPEMLKLIQSGKKGILKKAKKFENPEFPVIYVDKDHWAQVPEPGDSASIARKKDTTTFNVCGWCKWNSGALCRYNYSLLGKCLFNSLANISSEEHAFNNLCFLTSADEETYKDIEEGLFAALRQNKAEKQLIQDKIAILKKLKTDRKPMIAERRPYNWFKPGDPVMVYVAEWEDRIISDLWATATVLSEGITLQYDKKVHSGNYLGGHGGSHGNHRPDIMHIWEYEYLKAHLDFAKIYAKSDVSSYSAEQFLAALEVESGT